MEGPSLVLACEELKPFLKKKIYEATGSADLPYGRLTGSRLLKARSWGKHLLLFFADARLRIHFLMFGSYRIDNPRENRLPKLQLSYRDAGGEREIYFYSCAIKSQPKNFEKAYDWSVDLMSPKWDPSQARAAVKAKPETQVCDILMDQNVFSGLGNIMKNEILFNLKMHPETKITQLSAARVRKLVQESESYAWRFYEWKKSNALKRNWKIMRKKTCPECGGKVKKRLTGKLQRWSHFCSRCQQKE